MSLRKKIAKFITAIFACILIVSPIVLVEESHHNCNHEDCQICEVIRAAKETIRQTFNVSHESTSFIIAFASFFFVASILAVGLVKIKNPSLVKLKTKLSD